MTNTELKSVLEAHHKWLDGEPDGCRANLCGVNLRGARLCDAKNVDKVIWDSNTEFYTLQCPEEGAFIGWKKAHNHIVKLEICADALRSSATSRKCRCS